jgi:hypothetical protein
LISDLRLSEKKWVIVEAGDARQPEVLQIGQALLQKLVWGGILRDTSGSGSCDLLR